MKETTPTSIYKRLYPNSVPILFVRTEALKRAASHEHLARLREIHALQTRDCPMCGRGASFGRRSIPNHRSVFREGAEDTDEVMQMAEKKCDDKKCYKHGGLKVRGERLEGRVVSAKARNTAVIEIDRTRFFPKYQRWAKERSHMTVHNPSCIGAKVGDWVAVAETRKLSKTKAWTILEVSNS